MTQLTSEHSSTTATSPSSSMPAFRAFVVLRAGFTAAPILFGIDKFFNVMVEWTDYLWSGLPALLPLSGSTIMVGVGIVEIAAGILVAIHPRIGGYVVAAWLAGIVVNLLLVGDYYDIALRDFGLLLAAVALAQLATAFPSGRHEQSARRAA